MTTTERLLDAAKEIWAEYHRHPFVRGLADGTLDREKFRFYIIQDYLYLIDYAKVFAVGVSKAGDLKTMSLFADYVKEILDGEMDIHNGYMGSLGITKEEIDQSRPSLDNLSYTSYMIRIAYDEGPAEIAAAILSCALSYEVIAKEMIKENPDCIRDPFYGEWVRSYAGSEYHEANEVLIELTENLTRDYSENQLAHLTEIFVNCSRYEASFWEMAWNQKV